MASIVCPCCRGRKFIPVYDEEHKLLDKPVCGHCNGMGKITLDMLADEVEARALKDPIPPGSKLTDSK